MLIRSGQQPRARGSRLSSDQVRFSKYAPLPGCTGSPADAAAIWSGKLIIRQWWRWFTTFPSELKNAAGFAHRRCLPDYDASAVDTPTPSGSHRRYDEAEYALQFAIRDSPGGGSGAHPRRLPSAARLSPASARKIHELVKFVIELELGPFPRVGASATPKAAAARDVFGDHQPIWNGNSALRERSCAA
jgi:hypothetical protein